MDLRAQLQKSLGDSYRLERELGGGGMSRVFEAEETRLKRRVAIKVLSPELAQGISVERFEREIQTVAGLQQANIVPVLTAGDTDGLPFYTMPFVEGESLRAHLARGPLAITEVLGIMKDVSKALAYAHQRGVVHRDIKPDNVLLSGGTAVVTDFGIAKAISAARTSSGSATLTQIGTSIGTPAYMAPEQAAGDPNIDSRADIYSLGAMIYELLCGHAVFAGRTPQRMLAAHMGEAPVAIGELRADVPSALAELVMRCLEKDAALRPQAAGDIVRSLETTSGGGFQSMPSILFGGAAMFKKALAVYAGAFVVVAVVAKAAIVGIGLPDWVFAGSLIVMALGLPVVLWTGYVQRVARRAAIATPTYTPGGTPSLTHGTIATFALKAAPRVSWYRTARGGMYAFGTFIVFVAAFMIMRAFGIGPAGSLIGAGRLSARESVILTDFRTTNTDSTLGRVVSDAVRAGLNGSSAFTLASQASVVAGLQRMKREPTTRVDSAVARQLAVREGIKAFVDGEVTGVSGGYIVTLRLVRADSGIELASFRETGDGPRGLIDAADKLARALRSKAGESLRDVNATPPLFQATTGSLEALRKFSETVRANSMGSAETVRLARETVALDSTFASAWSLLGAALSNSGRATRSAIDSAMTQAYKYRDKLPAIERDNMIARYYSLGPGRDRQKAAAAYVSIMARADSSTFATNLGESMRTWRDYATAERLNAAAARRNPDTAIPLGNIAELQIDQGKFKEAEATIAKLSAKNPFYGSSRLMSLRFAMGDVEGAARIADSVRKIGGRDMAWYVNALAVFALRAGKLRESETIRSSVPPGGERPGQRINEALMQMAIRGATPALAARLDSAIGATPFSTLPMVDRPYLPAAVGLARVGKGAQANAMLARYRSEVSDTALRRERQPDEHNALGEIALAAGKASQAVDEFRKGDIGYDGLPATECNFCLPLNLGRAFAAAGQADSAIANLERYLVTPNWRKLEAQYDPVNTPAVHERLGQLYEEKGNVEKAAEHYRTFIDLWKNADPELQPRVAQARERMKKLTPVEGAKK